MSLKSIGTCLLLLSSCLLWADDPDKPLGEIPLDNYLEQWPQLEACVALVKSEKMDEALTCLDESIKAGEVAAGALNLKARVLLATDRDDDALNAIGMAVNMDGSQHLHYYQKAMVVSKKKFASKGFTKWNWTKEALASFEKAMELAPNIFRYREYVVIYKIRAPAIGGGDKKTAIKLAMEGLALSQKDNHYLLAYCYLTQKDYPKMYESLDAMLDQDVFERSLFGAGAKIALGKKQVDRAAKYGQVLIDKEPTYADGHEIMGDVFVSQGKHAEAVKAFEAALAIEPKRSAAVKKLKQAREAI